MVIQPIKQILFWTVSLRQATKQLMSDTSQAVLMQITKQLHVHPLNLDNSGWGRLARLGRCEQPNTPYGDDRRWMQSMLL